MNWPLALEIVRTLATIVGAAAAYFGIKRYLSDRSASRRLKWQKTTIQEILQKESKLEFESIREKYRSFAADRMKNELSAQDITDDSLRMILIELCADQVVVQMGNDTYALTTYLGQMQEMKELNARLLALQETFFTAQLEMLGKQDARIAELITQNRDMLAAAGYIPQSQNIRSIRPEDRR